ncbi:protein tyrosine kinase [Oesophagostomum dentatum]|uniref:Protein tyrosine kinase n=1 Tax=Oesophagostomum dentatum TaxID=61180 RepID=A0A0B1RQY5_OESDE|nr:protein tyrosine kinase [Oesophagostomum dentatum]
MDHLLCRFHHRTGTPVGDDVKLQRPVPKQRWELNSNKLTLVKKIGAGAFGEVWQGAMSIAPRKPPIIVAIKVTKVNEENRAKVDEMYKEARLMRQYKHKNVVAFYGIAKKYSDSVMIVMEMVEGGGLDHHLRKNPNISNRDRIGYASDVAVGLVYLHSKGCIHRDIACRNCLIDIKKNIVKISDFGLSKQAEYCRVPHGEKLPIRWQAPEVIMTRIYTRKSDVYSYGIFLWEVFNNAQKPYAGIDTKTIKENISNPKFRPEVDPKIPIVVQRVMRACWRADPKKRPEMTQAARYLVFASFESQESEHQLKSQEITSERKKAVCF